MKSISFITPIYNVRKEDIHRLLDSIYAQTDKIPELDFEVICVDDCSPTDAPRDYIDGYERHDSHPSNLRYIRHDINKRQGGARNTAVRNAEGEWLFYIDQDDFLHEGAIARFKKEIDKREGCDLIMFDSCKCDEGGKITSDGHYISVNSTDLMSGEDFLCRQEVPWTPWHYLYRRQFLIDNGIEFEENVRFEDVDYVMKCTAKASRMKFVPVPAIVHSVSMTQQSSIGNSPEKIIDLIKVSYRTGLVGKNEIEQGNEKAGEMIIRHHYFGYVSEMKKTLWRLPYSKLKETLRKYPPVKSENDNFLIRTTRNYPGVMALLIFTLGFFLKPTYLIYVKLKHVDK